MSGFLSQLMLLQKEPRDDSPYLLGEALIYQSDVAKRTIIVPRGFVTDLASVPRLPVVYLLTGNCATGAAVVHDWLYSSHEVSRAVADQVLREASQVCAVPGWRRWMMWGAVRLFGGNYWKQPS